MTSAENTQPKIEKTSQWQTERAKATTKESILHPGLKRHATNISPVKDAVWPRHVANEDSTSSSSASSDDEDAHSSGLKSCNRQRRKSSRDSYSKFNVGNEEYNPRGMVSKTDGRLNINVNETNNRGYLAKALVQPSSMLAWSFPKKIKKLKHYPPGRKGVGIQYPAASKDSSTATSTVSRPMLNIVVMVIGSRGDI